MGLARKNRYAKAMSSNKIFPTGRLHSRNREEKNLTSAAAEEMASDAAGAEDLNEWEHISSSSSSSSSTPSSPKWHDLPLIRENYLQEEPVFPPSDHENLDPVSPAPALSSSSVAANNPFPDDEQVVVAPSDHGPKEETLGGAVRPGRVSGVVSRACDCLFLGGGAWRCASAAAAAGVVAAVVVSLVYAKSRNSKWWWWWWWRSRAKKESAVVDNLILLVKHKEEKISQLMLQIAQMNEVMLAQRRVPVARVG